MEWGKREAWVRGKQQLIRAGILLQGEGAGAISFSEPAVTQRGAEHSGYCSCKVANSALTKALTKNRPGLSFTEEQQLCQKRAMYEEHRWEHVSACTHPCN